MAKYKRYDYSQSMLLPVFFEEQLMPGTLEFAIHKEKRDKNIPINQHVKEILDSVPRALNHDYVFTYRGQSFEEGGIKKSFTTACKNAGIPHGRKTENGITFHDLRRTAKTNMLKARLEKEYRDTILGHSLKGMDVHYLVLDDNTLTEAMNKFTRWIDGQLESANVDHSVDQEQKKQNDIAA